MDRTPAISPNTKALWGEYCHQVIEAGKRYEVNPTSETSERWVAAIVCLERALQDERARNCREGLCAWLQREKEKALSSIPPPEERLALQRIKVRTALEVYQEHPSLPQRIALESALNLLEEMLKTVEKTISDELVAKTAQFISDYRLVFTPEIYVFHLNEQFRRTKNIAERDEVNPTLQTRIELENAVNRLEEILQAAEASVGSTQRANLTDLIKFYRKTIASAISPLEERLAFQADKVRRALEAHKENRETQQVINLERAIALLDRMLKVSEAVSPELREELMHLITLGRDQLLEKTVVGHYDLPRRQAGGAFKPYKH